jgi:ketosteroid isomerase-like protein
MPSDLFMPAKPIGRRMFCARVLFLLLVAPALFAFTQPLHGNLPKGQKHESHHEIEQMEEAWRNAVLTGDTAAMDSLLADDYIAISANGTLQTKEDALARLRSGKRHITSLELALVTSFAHVAGINADGEAAGNFRYTRVYVRNAQGKWKIVSFEASHIREPKEQK